MRAFRAQGATQLSLLRSSTYCPLAGQGATEYLVLLAVVLIVALVSVALLGFFPGMASDAQLTQSKAYWQGASPVSITEIVVTPNAPGMTYPYIRIKNTGAYTIQITKLLGENRTAVNYYDNANGTSVLLTIATSSVFRLAPGEEAYFGISGTYNLPYNHYVLFSTPAACHGYGEELCALSQDCTSGGITVKNFGFEYVEYIDGQQLTKREIGVKPLLAKCTSVG